MSEDLILHSALDSMAVDFGELTPHLGDDDDWDRRIDRLREILDRRIREMLLSSAKRSCLLGILYRIDVAEFRAKEALAAPRIENQSAQLARLIIDRQLEKARTRLRFQPPPDDAPQG